MIMPDAARYRMPWGNSWRKRADQRCSAISFWTRHPPNWARHRVDHGTITGRGGDKFGARKAVFACNGCAFSPRPPREKIVRVMSKGRHAPSAPDNLIALFESAFSFAIFTRLLLFTDLLPHGVLQSCPSILYTMFQMLHAESYHHPNDRSVTGTPRPPLVHKSPLIRSGASRILLV